MRAVILSHTRSPHLSGEGFREMASLRLRAAVAMALGRLWLQALRLPEQPQP
jgi:hypothetical protein